MDVGEGSSTTRYSAARRGGCLTLPSSEHLKHPPRTRWVVRHHRIFYSIWWPLTTSRQCGYFCCYHCWFWRWIAEMWTLMACRCWNSRKTEWPAGGPWQSTKASWIEHGKWLPRPYAAVLSCTSCTHEAASFNSSTARRTWTPSWRGNCGWTAWGLWSRTAGTISLLKSNLGRTG